MTQATLVAVGESTLVSISIGLAIALAGGLFLAGTTWGRLMTQLKAMEQKFGELQKAIAHLDRAGSADAEALSRKAHQLSSQVGDLELRCALIERDLGIPVGRREDRTPVTSMPHRLRSPSGGHPTSGPDESR